MNHSASATSSKRRGPRSGRATLPLSDAPDALPASHSPIQFSVPARERAPRRRCAPCASGLDRAHVEPEADALRQTAAAQNVEAADARGLDGVFSWLGSTAMPVEPCSAPDDDQKIAFVLHLRNDSFSINNQPTRHPYNATTHTLLEAIDAGRLPPDVQDMLEDISCQFSDGAVVVQLCDYRQLPLRQSDAATPLPDAPLVRRVLLKPDGESIVDDVNRLWNSHKGDNPSWGPDQYLALEQSIVHAVAPSLCLDPSPLVGRVAAVLHYNRLKMNYRAPDFLRPAVVQRRSRRSLAHFLIARAHKPAPLGITATMASSSANNPPPTAADGSSNMVSGHGRRAVRAGVPPTPPVLPLEHVDSELRPSFVARSAYTRTTKRKRDPEADVAPPRPSALNLIENRELKLRGASASLSFNSCITPSGALEGCIRMDSDLDPKVSNPSVRFPLGSLSSSLAFVTQLRALCESHDAFNVEFDSSVAPTTPAVRPSVAQQQP